MPAEHLDWAPTADGLLGVGFDADDEGVEDLVARIVRANGPEDRLDTPGMDADRDLHQRSFFAVMADADVDLELAEALYASEGDHRRSAWAVDAASTVRSLKRAGVLVGVVSDIHFDIRPGFADAGIGDAVDFFALSFEVGAQKPSLEIYGSALEALGVGAADALMVGDRAYPDGGAVEHGLSVLLLPPLRSSEQQRLDRVLDLALGSSD